MMNDNLLWRDLGLKTGHFSMYIVHPANTLIKVAFHFTGKLQLFKCFTKYRILPGKCSSITPCFLLYWALTMCKIET